MRIVLLSLAWFCLQGYASAQAASLEIETTLESVYTQAQSGQVDLLIKLNDPEHSVDTGVLFLNIVERDAARRFPQAAHKIFRSAQETPSIFRVPYEGAVLRAGLETQLSFQLRGSAKISDYALVVQLYQGAETRPSRVSPENRVALKGFHFTIVGN